MLVGSCLIETGRILAERLRERGVRAVHIVEERDGRARTKNPRKRAAEVYEFVEGDADVLCARRARSTRGTPARRADGPHRFGAAPELNPNVTASASR